MFRDLKKSVLKIKPHQLMITSQFVIKISDTMLHRIFKMITEFVPFYVNLFPLSSILVGLFLVIIQTMSIIFFPTVQWIIVYMMTPPCTIKYLIILYFILIINNYILFSRYCIHIYVYSFLPQQSL